MVGLFGKPSGARLFWAQALREPTLLRTLLAKRCAFALEPSMDTTWSALIIDDDPGVRQSMRLCLEADNARVMGVATSAGALEALDRGYFDVIFLDLWLQSESGLTVLPEILRRQPGIGVVVITAFASFETAVEAMRLGAVDYLPKPFTPEQVRHAGYAIPAVSGKGRPPGTNRSPNR